MLPTIFLSRGTTIYACISQQFPILTGILYPLGSVLLHAVAVVNSWIRYERTLGTQHLHADNSSWITFSDIPSSDWP